MNGLSWLLYLSDALGSAKTASSIVLIGGAFIGVLGGLMAPLIMDESYLPSGSKFLKAVTRPYIVTMALALGIVILAPSQNTIMLIAASQVGEQVLASPGAQQATTEAGSLALDSMKLLRKYINDQLGSASSSSEPAKN